MEKAKKLEGFHSCELQPSRTRPKISLDGDGKTNASVVLKVLVSRLRVEVGRLKESWSEYEGGRQSL